MAKWRANYCLLAIDKLSVRMRKQESKRERERKWKRKSVMKIYWNGEYIVCRLDFWPRKTKIGNGKRKQWKYWSIGTALELHWSLQWNIAELIFIFGQWKQNKTGDNKARNEIIIVNWQENYSAASTPQFTIGRNNHSNSNDNGGWFLIVSIQTTAIIKRIE